MRVLVLTTSYPRVPGDVAGRFIADAVERLRERGIDVEVVSPADFPALRPRVRLGDRREPSAPPLARALLVRSFLALVRRRGRAGGARAPTSSTRTGCPPAAVALLTRKPVVAQVWGTDVELARRVPWLARRGAAAGAGRRRAVDTRSPTRRAALGAREVR